MPTAEKALDELLETLQAGDLSPLELRMLLWLAEREEATQSELTSALGTDSGAIGQATRRLAMRGLITRRFEGGRMSRFVLCITTRGVATVVPLVGRIARPHTGIGAHSRPLMGMRPDWRGRGDGTE